MASWESKSLLQSEEHQREQLTKLQDAVDKYKTVELEKQQILQEKLMLTNTTQTQLSELATAEIRIHALELEVKAQSNTILDCQSTIRKFQEEVFESKEKLSKADFIAERVNNELVHMNLYYTLSFKCL